MSSMVEYNDEAVDQFVASLVCIGIIGMLVSALLYFTCSPKGLVGIGIVTTVGGVTLVVASGDSAYAIIASSGVLLISAGRRNILQRNIERHIAVSRLAGPELLNEIGQIVSTTESTEIDSDSIESDTSSTQSNPVCSNINDTVTPGQDDGLSGVLSKSRDEEDIRHCNHDTKFGSTTAPETAVQVSQVGPEESKNGVNGKSAAHLSSVIAKVVGIDSVVKARTFMEWRSNGYKIVPATTCGQGEWHQSDDDTESKDTIENGLKHSYIARLEDDKSITSYEQHVASDSGFAVEDRDSDNNSKRDLKADDNKRDIIESREASQHDIEKNARDQLCS